MWQSRTVAIVGLVVMSTATVGVAQEQKGDQRQSTKPARDSMPAAEAARIVSRERLPFGSVATIRLIRGIGTISGSSRAPFILFSGITRATTRKCLKPSCDG